MKKPSESVLEIARDHAPQMGMAPDAVPVVLGALLRYLDAEAERAELKSVDLPEPLQRVPGAPIFGALDLGNHDLADADGGADGQVLVLRGGGAALETPFLPRLIAELSPRAQATFAELRALTPRERAAVLSALA